MTNIGPHCYSTYCSPFSWLFWYQYFNDQHWATLLLNLLQSIQLTFFSAYTTENISSIKILISRWKHLKMKYFSSSWYRNTPGDTVCSSVTCALSLWKWIFRQLLVPKYFGENWFALGIILAINTHKNGIFRRLLVPKYFGEYWFTLGVTCALDTHENGIFRQVSVPKYSREYCLWLMEHVHWIRVKVKSFSSSWCRNISENIVLPSV